MILLHFPAVMVQAELTVCAAASCCTSTPEDAWK